MNIAIDIGNTRTKAGLFEGDQLVGHEAWENGTAANLFALLANHRVQNAILSTVGAPLPGAERQALEGLGCFVALSHETLLPIRNTYSTPATLGKDRLAAVVGAHALYPGRAALVIDAGTCITYDWLSAEGVFGGGNISPGIQMRLKAMHHFTERLPLAEAMLPDAYWGSSTAAALQNGALRGAIHEMEGVIALTTAQTKDLIVILTGGDAVFFAEHVKSQIFVHQNLVLVGLNKILNHNVEHLA